MIILRFYENKIHPTDEFRTSGHTESKLELQLRQLILRTENLHSLRETLVS